MPGGRRLSGLDRLLPAALVSPWLSPGPPSALPQPDSEAGGRRATQEGGHFPPWTRGPSDGGPCAAPRAAASDLPPCGRAVPGRVSPASCAEAWPGVAAFLDGLSCPGTPVVSCHTGTHPPGPDHGLGPGRALPGGPSCLTALLPSAMSPCPRQGDGVAGGVSDTTMRLVFSGESLSHARTARVALGVTVLPRSRARS